MIELIHSLVPYDWPVYIAGGYAACPALADDIDIWVRYVHRAGSSLSSESTRLYEEIKREELKRNLHRFDLLAEPPIEVRRVVAIERYATNHVCKIKCGEQKFDILFSEDPIEHILAAFDISTHQIAMNTRTLEVIKGDRWTPITEPPLFLQLSSTDKEKERMKKICKRYGYIPHPDAW